MSFKVNKTTITLTRGDTLILHLNLTVDGEPYESNPEDSIRFALKSDKVLANKEYSDKEPLILKDIPTNTLELKIDPEDTKSLPFGNYKYDIEFRRASDGFVRTFIADADFVISREVY